MAFVKIRGNTQILAATITDAEINGSAAIALSKLAEAVIQADGGQAFSADQAMGSNKLTGLANGTDPTDAVNKGQLDTAIAGLDFQADVLDKQIDATLDPGATPTAGDRYIIEDAAALHANFGTITGVADDDIVEYNGSAFVIAYNISDFGAGAICWNIADAFFESYDGSSWTEFGGLAGVTAGSALTKSGNTLNVNVDDSSVEVSGDALQVKALGIATGMIAADAVDKAKIAADVAGLGITQAAGGELDVNTDNSTVEISTDTLQVKDAGITAAKLAAAVAGNGLTGGAGSALAVGSGNGVSVSADAIALNLDGSTLKLGGSGIALADLTSGKVLIGNGSNIATARTIADQETPSGTLNGSNKEFTLANTPANAAAIFINGLRQIEGAGESYTISSDTITFIDAPISGDKIRVDYSF